MKRNRQYSIFTVSMLLLLLVTACGFSSRPESKPAVKINVSPEQLVVGQVVNIQAIAVDQTGVSRVDVQVDGRLLASLPADAAQTSFIASQTWVPDLPGSHIIQAQAYNVDNQASELVNVIVQVGEAVTQAEPGCRNC